MSCKPKCLVQEQEWIRAKEIVKLYGIGLSTVWNWASKGKLHPVKVSPRVTVFSIAELKELFTYGDKNLQKVEPQQKQKKKRKIKKNIFTPVKHRKIAVKKIQKKSDKEMINEYYSRKNNNTKPYFEDEEVSSIITPELLKIEKIREQKIRERLSKNSDDTSRYRKNGSGMPVIGKRRLRGGLSKMNQLPKVKTIKNIKGK